MPVKALSDGDFELAMAQAGVNKRKPTATEASEIKTVADELLGAPPLPPKWTISLSRRLVLL